MKYLNVEKFDSTGLVKTLMVPKDQGRWRIYSHDIEAEMEDLKYYKELGSHFGIVPSDMVRVPQGHSSSIMIVKKEDAGKGVISMEIDGKCDGAITNEKGIMLLTIESDCTPVYILDPIKKAIGMVHSGWRGTVGKITQNAIDLMIENYGCDKKDLLIHFGPAICGKCYEVGMDLIPEFKKILECDEIHKVFVPILNKPEKYYLDVTESIRLSLLKYGIREENMTRSEYCTYHSGIFNSWRLERDSTRQMLTGIMLV